MLRSGFTAMPYEAFERSHVEDSPTLRARLADRIRLTRFMLDLTRATAPDVWAKSTAISPSSFQSSWSTDRDMILGVAARCGGSSRRARLK